MCDLFCLICASPTDLIKGESPKDFFVLDALDNSSNSLLEKELEVIFTLRNVLEVPSNLCQKFLAENGQPTEWGISNSICSVCRKSLKETQDLFKKIQNLIKEYESLKRGFKNAAKEKCGISPYQRDKKRGKQTESVVSRVKKYLAGLENVEIKDDADKRCGKRRSSTSKPSTSSTPKKSSNRRERMSCKTRKSDEAAESQFAEIIIKTEQDEMFFFNENDDDQDFPMSHLIEPDNSGWEQDVEETYEDNEEQGSGWTTEDAEEFKPGTEKLVTQIRVRDYAKENARRRELRAMKAAGIKKSSRKKSQVRIRDYEKEKARREELKAIRAAAASATVTSEIIKSETTEQMELNDTSFQEGRPKRIRKPIRVLKADSDLEDENDDAGMDDDEDADFEVQLPDLDSGEDEGEDEINEHSTQRPKSNTILKIDKSGRIRDYQKEKERRLKLKALKKKNKKEPDPIPQKRKITRSKFLQSCPYCPTALVNSVEYSGHILRVHRGVPKPYVCEFEFCEKTFYKMTTLLMHIDLRHQSEIKNREEGDDKTTSEIPEVDSEINEEAMKYETNLFKTIFRVELAPQNITINSEEQTRMDNDCSAEPMEQFQPNNPNLPFECRKCNYSFSVNWMLDTHILRCHYGDMRPMKCDSCDSRFQKPGILENHRKKFHPENTTAYNGSGVSLQTRIAELEKDKEEKREKIVTGSDSTSKYIYHCRKCENVKFSSRIMAEVHLRRLHGGPKAKFKCSECELYFLSEIGRKMHCEKIHSKEVKRKGKEGIHYCSECDSEFKSAEFLERHMRSTHNGNKEFMCDACGQTFSNNLYLLAHQRQMHFEELGLEPIKCRECGQVVYSNRGLKNHMIMEHTKKYPFNCPFCSKGFTQEHVCNQHVRVQHFGIRAFICNVCGKTFTQIGHLQTHTRIHTGEKPYKCKAPGCGKEYSDKPTFNRHVETHGDQVHVCPTCNREFKVWHSFRLHCKTHDKNFEPRRQKLNRNRQTKKFLKAPRKRKDDDDDSSEESGSNDNSSMPAQQQGDANNHGINVPQPLLQYHPPTNIIVPHFYPEMPLTRF